MLRGGGVAHGSFLPLVHVCVAVDRLCAVLIGGGGGGVHVSLLLWVDDTCLAADR